jgi:leucyl-tRNA synthetase
MEAGVTPLEYASTNIAKMRDDFDRIGISYDWSRVQTTCRPAYYQWTQWLFLELYKRGLAYRVSTNTLWCTKCATALSRMQATNGACWRCGSSIELRNLPQWYLSISRFADRLLVGSGNLPQWSATGVRLLLRGLHGADKAVGNDRHCQDWLVSRQRSWGTPIPIIYCDRCGTVEAKDLPVQIPDSAEWNLGPSALKNCSEFVSTQCPRCQRAAIRETDTLDCFFDDAWSFLSCVKQFDNFVDFPSNQMAAWMPVDHFHSGFGTFAYLNLYRFIGFFLFDIGLVTTEEPLRRYDGNDVLTHAGRKMSKSAGNTVAASEVVATHGADALRLAVLWAAAPERSIDWEHVDIRRSVALCRRVAAVFSKAADRIISLSVNRSGTTSRVEKLAAGVRSSWQRISKFIDDYRPNAAVEEIALQIAAIDDFVSQHATTKQFSHDDASRLRAILQELSVVLSPFAPFLAEECAAIVGLPTLATNSTWPLIAPANSA